MNLAEYVQKLCTRTLSCRSFYEEKAPKPYLWSQLLTRFERQSDIGGLSTNTRSLKTWHREQNHCWTNGEDARNTKKRWKQNHQNIVITVVTVTKDKSLRWKWKEGHQPGEIGDIRARFYRREVHQYGKAAANRFRQNVSPREEQEFRQPTSLPPSSPAIFLLMTTHLWIQLSSAVCSWTKGRKLRIAAK